MNTRTTSIRLKNELVDEIDSKCAKLGCCRNDYIKESVKFMLYNESDFDFGNDPEEVTKDTEPKIFDCKDGNLFHDGNLFGKCADFKLNAGKVYDSFDNYLGQTRDSLKPTVTLID